MQEIVLKTFVNKYRLYYNIIKLINNHNNQTERSYNEEIDFNKSTGE